MDIRDFLHSQGITYQWFDHPAVFTCEESAKLPSLPGANTKNLFLKEERAERYFLVSVGHEKRVHLRELRRVLGTRPLSFGSAEQMKAHLGVEPGSVTLLGLVYDTEHHVQPIIDESLWNAPAIICHQLTNTASVVIPHAGIETFFTATGHIPKVMEVPGM